MKFFVNILVALCVGIVTVYSNESRSAILIEDGSQAVQRHSVKTASDGLGMRRLRRVGFGASGAGPLGVGGVNLELNFSPETSLLTGFGGGSGYQSFTLQVKKVLGGTWFMPYFAGGYSRWYNASEPGKAIGGTSPNFLGEKLLSQDAKRTGRVSENLLYPAVGLQYMQLTGPWTGSSVFIEVVMLMDIQDFVTAPTGTVGYLYYF